MALGSQDSRRQAPCDGISRSPELASAEGCVLPRLHQLQAPQREDSDRRRSEDLYLRGALLVDEVVQRRYPLARINEGFAALERGENGRGVIVFD